MTTGHLYQGLNQSTKGFFMFVLNKNHWFLTMCDTAAASQIKESRPETTIEFSTRLLSLLYSIQYKSDVMRSVRSPCHNKMQTTTTLHTLDIKSLAVNFAPASWEKTTCKILENPRK